jgi:thiosulfate dehydrogenase [quinone] large subunit
MTATDDRATRPTGVERVTAEVDRWAGRYGPVAARWLLGLMWLSNVNWKVPTGFGGLRNFVQYGVDHPVAPGSAWVFDNLVLSQMALFGWFTLVVEVAVAALLLSGRFVRTAAVLSAAMSVGIGLAVANAPDEWYWAYLLMLGLSVAVLVLAPVTRPHSPRLMGAVVVGYGAVVAVTNWAAGFTGDDNVTRTLFTGRNDIPDEFGFNTFSGSVALGLVFVALGLGALVVDRVGDRARRALGWGVVGIATVLLFTYRGDPDTLVIGLGSRAVSCGVLATLGLSLLPVRERTEPVG